MRDEIILIGPMNVGKSSVAESLSLKMDKPHIGVDRIRQRYYDEIGYDKETAERLFEEKGFFEGMYRYWKPFELHAIKRILSEYADCIFDFGAGHSVYEDDAMFGEAKELLADFKNVVLLLPSADVEESIEFFRERRNMDDGTLEINRHWMTHHSNYDLCTHVVYVKDKAKDIIVDEVCAICNAG